MKQYEFIYNTLKQDILNDKFSSGDLLPSENELSRTFQTTRVTIRQALGLLVQEGYVTKHQGKGSVVTMKRNTLGLLSFKGFSEVVGSEEITVETNTLIAPERQNWPQPFFYPLTSDIRHSGCVFLKRLRLAGHKPVMLELTWFPNQLDRFCEGGLEENSLFGTLRRRHQIDIQSVEQEVRAIPASAETALFLDLEVQSPIVHIYRNYSTSLAGFSVYSSLFCNTDTYSLGNIFKHSHS